MAELMAAYSPPIPVPCQKATEREPDEVERECGGDRGDQIDAKGNHKEFFTPQLVGKATKEECA